ncbi:MAG TPA: SMP-30/gluconolactonase/LRE family protein [Mesorhizobium sp.]|jgi:sugar lactone lactonase YvrE|nr:SMP-30/gluconolactonase/LRE family protein [Mesorhizobium sp.]
MAAELVLPVQNIVGESLIWHAGEKALFWVDIVEKRIHRFEPGSGLHDLWPTPDFATSIGLHKDGGFIVGLRREVRLWTPDGPFEVFAAPEPDAPDNRLNEGRVAPDGSFWVATMQTNLCPDGSPKAMTASRGAIYRIDPSGTVSRLTPHEFGIPNTMCWTRDGRFLTADTLLNEIYAYDLAADGRSLSEKRIFHAGFSRGLPDGSCLDAEDGLWNCRVVGGACVARFAPGGELAQAAELPATWPTSCAFGGGDLSTLFVTSARFTMSAGHLAANPQEGGLFAVDTSVRGLPENRFG